MSWQCLRCGGVDGHRPGCPDETEQERAQALIGELVQKIDRCYENEKRLMAEIERLRAAENAAFHAFVVGAKWWEYRSTGGTMWPSDLREVEEEARRHYPYAPHLLVVEAQKKAAELEQELDRLRAVAEAAKRLRRMHVYDEKTNVHKRINDIVHIDAEETLFAAVDALEERESDG